MLSICYRASVWLGPPTARPSRRDLIIARYRKVPCDDLLTEAKAELALARCHQWLRCEGRSQKSLPRNPAVGAARTP